jgi:hypothetical protein
MIPSFQETDSRIANPWPYYWITYQFANATTGRAISDNFIIMPVGSNILRQSWELVYNLKDSNVAIPSQKLLSTIQNTLYNMQQYQFDLSFIPNLQGKILDDNAILFEFICRDFRVGFVIEPNIEDSNWYLVTSKKLGENSHSGYLYATDLRYLVTHLLQFIIANS